MSELGLERATDVLEEMDPDDARDYTDQGIHSPQPDRDMDEDSEILATLLKHLP